MYHIEIGPFNSYIVFIILGIVFVFFFFFVANFKMIHYILRYKQLICTASQVHCVFARTSNILNHRVTEFDSCMKKYVTINKIVNKIRVTTEY